MQPDQIRLQKDTSVLLLGVDGRPAGALAGQRGSGLELGLFSGDI